MDFFFFFFSSISLSLSLSMCPRMPLTVSTFSSPENRGDNRGRLGMNT
ncbi:uncharacterized protein CTRU02_206683 [Colletotrichum truncatum]|uniref:Uncharacterized protein n=1 Tax=Colletotrichum truncatum TaxID=5467 RepID=A0ACC3Z7N3_COLTU